jgi:hypothetical protein
VLRRGSTWTDGSGAGRHTRREPRQWSACSWSWCEAVPLLATAPARRSARAARPNTWRWLLGAWWSPRGRRVAGCRPAGRVRWPPPQTYGCGSAPVRGVTDPSGERQGVGGFVEKRREDHVGTAVKTLAGDEDLRPLTSASQTPAAGREVAQLAEHSAPTTAGADQHDDLGDLGVVISDDRPGQFERREQPLAMSLRRRGLADRDGQCLGSVEDSAVRSGSAVCGHGIRVSCDSCRITARALHLSGCCGGGWGGLTGHWILPPRPKERFASPRGATSHGHGPGGAGRAGRLHLATRPASCRAGWRRPCRVPRGVPPPRRRRARASRPRRAGSRAR